MNGAATTPPSLRSVSLAQNPAGVPGRLNTPGSFCSVGSASSCEAIEVEMCRGLSYNLTSFPNIWLSVSDQREAAALLRQYRVKRFTSCFITKSM